MLVLVKGESRNAGAEGGCGGGATPARLSSRPWVQYLVFTLLASLYLLPFMRVLLPWTNEGTLAVGAARIVHGEVFARDFFEVMGPGTFYWLAAFFKLFGVTFLAMRICLFVTSLGTGICIFFLSRRILGKCQTLPCILLAGTYYGLQWPGISHHVDSNFFALLAVACLVLWWDRRSAGLLAAAGALAGVTACIHQPKGMMLFVCILLWLAIQRFRKAAPRSAFGGVTAGFLGTGMLVLGYFWSQGALGSLYYANVVWPSLNYGDVNKVPYALGLIHEYWNHWVIVKGSLNWSTCLAAVLIAPFLFIAALPVLLPAAGMGYGWKTARPEIVLYILCGAALWLSEMHRKDIYHLVFGSPLLAIACIYFLAESRLKISDYALQALTITATFLAIFNLFVVSTAHSVATRVGPVAMYKDSPVLAFVDSHTARGEEIFTYPYCPIYYFLSSTTNPTRYSILTYNANPTSEFREVIHVLDERRVRYVLWDTNFLAKSAPVVFSKAALTPPDGFLIEQYLESHYNLIKDEDGFRIMERKSDAIMSAEEKIAASSPAANSSTAAPTSESLRHSIAVANTLPRQ